MKKKKLSKTGRSILTMLLIISLGIAGFSGYQIYKELNQYRVNDQKYEDLRDTVVSTPEVVEESEETSNEVTIDWAALRDMNADIAGWIHQENTPIDYPIVYATDNDYYLRHTLDGEYSIFGTIFVDYTNNRGFEDKNTVLYGHHFYHYDDTMFTTLDYYNDQSYYDSHTELDLYTPDGNYKLYPIAGVIKSGSDAYVRTSFISEDDYASYILNFISQSTFLSKESFSGQDQTVLLSSCTDLIEDGRYALFCKLVKVS